MNFLDNQPSDFPKTCLAASTVYTLVGDTPTLQEIDHEILKSVSAQNQISIHSESSPTPSISHPPHNNSAATNTVVDKNDNGLQNSAQRDQHDLQSQETGHSENFSANEQLDYELSHYDTALTMKQLSKAPLEWRHGDKWLTSPPTS